MGLRKKVRPTSVPSGPALVRPAVGVLLLSLGGTAELGCKPHGQPPMAQPGPDEGEQAVEAPPPMNEPMPPPELEDEAPMPNEGEAVEAPPPMIEPEEPPKD